MRELRWKKADDWCMDSDPPGFTICRCAMISGWALQAWHGREHLLTTEGEGAVDRCKAACQDAADGDKQ